MKTAATGCIIDEKHKAVTQNIELKRIEHCFSTSCTVKASLSRWILGSYLYWDYFAYEAFSLANSTKFCSVGLETKSFLELYPFFPLPINPIQIWNHN